MFTGKGLAGKWDTELFLNSGERVKYWPFRYIRKQTENYVFFILHELARCGNEEHEWCNGKCIHIY